MDVMSVVIQLFDLIANIVRLTLEISKKSKR